jgi:putative acetyltransferase
MSISKNHTSIPENKLLFLTFAFSFNKHFFPMHIALAQSAADFELGKVLFREYAETLEFNLCFQGFEAELENIHLKYAAPEGALFLVKNEAGEGVGCIAVRRFKDEETAELKRMYLRKGERGQGTGQALLGRALEAARALGYHRIRLDTIPGMMDAAIRLYRKNGFSDIEPYRKNPVEGAIFLEKRL